MPKVESIGATGVESLVLWRCKFFDLPHEEADIDLFKLKGLLNGQEHPLS
jgi:hypothetical protein